MMSRQQTLYSLRTEGPDYSITKFVDGEVESSYTCTPTECTCPAGHRPSCRHRQMLPQMLAHGIVDTHWFLNFDNNRVVDFNGELKSNLDQLNELAQVNEAKIRADIAAAGPYVEESISGPVAAKASWRRL